MAQQDDLRRSRQDCFRSDEEERQDETAVIHGLEVNRVRLGDHNENQRAAVARN